MKKLFSLLSFFVLAHIAIAQNPSTGGEYCPLESITFSGTVPGGFSSVVNIQGMIISGTTVTGSGTANYSFSAKFTDENISHIYRVNYQNSSNNPAYIDITYKNVKSLFYNVSHYCTLISPDYTTMTWPLCQITANTVHFGNVQYANVELPVNCFGTITGYDYLLPAGWKLGAATSNGTNWLPGNNNVSITSDFSTGDGVFIRIKPGATCTAAGISNNHQESTVRISRPKPTFTLSPTDIQIKCEYPKTQTFTVSTSQSSICSLTYEWEVGAYWNYNGSPAPTSPFIAGASITLVSEAVANYHGQVKVTPILNGVRQATMICNSTWERPNFGIVGGQTTLCTGTSALFSIYNEPINVVSYNWTQIASLPNYGATVITANTPSLNSTTITKVNSGVIKLLGSITDRCQQSYSNEYSSNILVGGYASGSTLSGYTLAYPPCYTPLCTPPAVSNPIAVSNVSGTTIYTGTAYQNTTNNVNIYGSSFASGTWSLVGGSVYSWSQSSGNAMQFYPMGGAGDYAKFRLTANNSCGSLFYDISFYPKAYTARPSVYQVYPNPAKDNLTVTINETKSDILANKSLAVPTSNIREVTIVDKMGVVLRKQLFSQNTKQARVNVSGLAKGFYVLKIFNGTDYTSLSFLKE